MSPRPEADPQIGRTLGGQYRIEALLGAGGMGRVYRGRQLSVNRAVAIKLIAGQAPHPREWVHRFRREAEATASLSHPNSVRLFDFGVTDSEELFMVMELLEGSDLSRQLQDHGPLPLPAALSVARQVLLALCEAHALGITHRDIKPDNIFLANVRGADVVAKVMDFGIAGLAHAQRKSRLTGTGVIIGTPLYMSPEQAQGLPVDGKSDVYSLGVVLFEMLTGRPVFESHTAVTLLLAHVARAPMRLDEAGVQLREQSSLQALLDRMLAKVPGERPSASEALDSVTTLSARLGVAGSTGRMRAISAPSVSEPAARRGARAPSTPNGARVMPPSAANHDADALHAARAPGRQHGPPPAAASEPAAQLHRTRSPSAHTGNEPGTPPLAAAPVARIHGTQAPSTPTGKQRNPQSSAAGDNTPAPSTPTGKQRNAQRSAAGDNTPAPSALTGRQRGAQPAAAGDNTRAASALTGPPRGALSAAGDSTPASSALTGKQRGAQPAAAADGSRPLSLRAGSPEDGDAKGDTGALSLRTEERVGAALFAGDSARAFKDSSMRLVGDAAEQAFQRARAPQAHTGMRLRPGLVLLGAGIVLSAATALALRWVPALIDAAQLEAAVGAHVATPAPPPAQRIVLIHSQPSNALVLVDGEKVGTTPYQLPVHGDTEISIAREGYARQLVNVPYESHSPLLVKLIAQSEDKKKARERTDSADGKAPFFSHKQENLAHIEPRGEARAGTARASRGAVIAQSEPAGAARSVREPIELVEPEPASALLPDPSHEPADLPDPRQLEAQADDTDDIRSNGRLSATGRGDGERAPTAGPEGHDTRGISAGPESGATRERDIGRSAHVLQRERGAERDVGLARERELANEHGPARDDGPLGRDLPKLDGSEQEREYVPPRASETSRSAATKIEAIREDEVAEISLDDDERAHVSQHYGFRAFGRAVARAVGRVLIPYPNRERRAALAQLPLAYSSFREARAAYQHNEVDATSFQEAVWQLRERRRQKIWVERDRFARGQLSQGQYQAKVDRIWDEFWGERR